MIDKAKVAAIADEFIQESGADVFLVDVTVSADNDIVVEIDSDNSVDIDTCCDLTRFIEDKMSRDVEDYSLEVGSSGLTSPFKNIRQYNKNVGNEIELLSEGKKIIAVLDAVGDDDITITISSKSKKQPAQQLRIPFSKIDYAKYNLKFK